jgi:hypothetical protein
MATTAARQTSKPKQTTTGAGKAAIKEQRKQVDALEKLGMVPEWKEVPELRQLHFGALVEKRTLLKDEIKFRESKVKELDEEIQAALAVSGVEKVIWEDRPVQIVESKSASKVVPEKLLLLGVPADTIAQATEPGKPYSYLLVGKPSGRQ